MKCSNPECNRDLGLVAYWRGWFDKRHYCSKQCRDAFVAERPKQSQQEWGATSYCRWPLLPPTENLQPKPAFVRARARSSAGMESRIRP